MFWFERDRRIRVTMTISPEEGNTCLRTSPPRWPPTCGPDLAVPSMHPPPWRCGRGCHEASSTGWPTTGTTPRPSTRPDAWSTTCPLSSSWDEPCSTTSPTWVSRTTHELPWPPTDSTSPTCWSRSPMPPWAMWSGTSGRLFPRLVRHPRPARRWLRHPLPLRAVPSGFLRRLPDRGARLLDGGRVPIHHSP